VKSLTPSFLLVRDVGSTRSEEGRPGIPNGSSLLLAQIRTRGLLSLRQFAQFRIVFLIVHQGREAMKHPVHDGVEVSEIDP
jgi:hypothetical protein